MATTRIYQVTDKETGAARLVEAATAAQARHHVTSDRFTVEVASAVTVARSMGSGMRVEVAGAEREESTQGANE